MTKKKIVVVGGVAAGASAAAKARRMNEDAEVIIFERGPYVSFANCGLPYYIGDVIENREELLLVSPERFKERYNIDVLVDHEVTKIYRSDKTISVKTEANEFVQEYDVLILATGGTPIKPPITGINQRNIFTLWTVPDADQIKEWLSYGSNNVAVIGGGFIGLETAECLYERGLKVTVVEKMDQVMPPYDKEISDYVVNHLRRKGVEVILSDGVSEFIGEEKMTTVRLESGKEIEADFAILSIGVKPEIQLAVDAGLEIGDQKGLVVDEFMKTSDHHIYAAGDIVESVHLVSNTMSRIPLAGPANKQGRIAGNNGALDVLGSLQDESLRLDFRGVIGTSIVKLFDLTIAQTGLSEKSAKLLGKDIFVSYTHSQDHAGYYPNAETMLIKLIVEKSTGKLVGAQIVGPKGVDKRLDVLATAIHGGMTVADLEHLDLAYAPPYSSAKDPVIIAGMVAANIVRGQFQIAVEDDLRDDLTDWQIIDVRTKSEYEQGHIPEAINIPIDEFREHINKIRKHNNILLYCAIGHRSYTAFRILKNLGFTKVYSLSGGYHLWSRTLPYD